MNLTHVRPSQQQAPAPASLTVLPPIQQTTALLIQRAKTFHAGIGSHLRSAAGYSLLLGQTMLSLKAAVPHGSFQELRKAELPEISERTGRYYMALTERVKSKTATIAVLLEQPELLTYPDLAEEQRAKLDKAVFDEFDGKTITEIAREEKVIRPPKKHSEVDHRGKEKLSAAEKKAAQRAEDLDWIGLYCGKGATLLRDPERALRFTQEDRDRIINMNVRVNNFLRGQVDKAERKKIEQALAVEDRSNAECGVRSAEQKKEGK